MEMKTYPREDVRCTVKSLTICQSESRVSRLATSDLKTDETDVFGVV
jgi:hypothetical protein